MTILIRAIANAPNAYLWLLGDGPERDNLVKLAADLGVSDRVRFPGWKTNAYGYLAAADAFAVTSLHEPLGNVCFEGWGAGKPTIASRAEGPSWVMTDEVDALMVDCADAAGLTTAIERLRADPALRQRLSEGGQATLRNRFSEDAISAAYIDLFKPRNWLPMKVSHFHFGKDGGAERFFVHLANALARRGIETDGGHSPQSRLAAGSQCCCRGDGEPFPQSVA